MEASKTTGQAESEPKLSPLQIKVQKLIKDQYHALVTKFDSHNMNDLVNKKKSDEVDVNLLQRKIYTTPIEDLGITKTAMDENVLNNVLKNPLFIEIKEVRNVSQPYQRVTEKISSKDDEEKEKKRLRKLRNQTFQFKAHDGCRLIKIIMLFQDQEALVRSINEVNKFCLYNAYLSPVEANTFVIDTQDQIVQIYNDRNSAKVQEDYQMMQGLPIKYTSAPRFVFLNDKAGEEEGENDQAEQEDEFSDLFKHFDVPDLTSSERTYIKRYEQLGFWRKRFIGETAISQQQQKQQ